MQLGSGGHSGCGFARAHVIADGHVTDAQERQRGGSSLGERLGKRGGNQTGLEERREIRYDETL